jgi:hypothetical protein
MITTVQQAEIARILGFPNLSPMSSLQVHYPYFSSQLALWQPYAMLINRLSQAAPYDEVQYMGAESPLFGSFFTPSAAQLTASTPSAIATGVIAQVNVDGIVTLYTTIAGDTPISVIANIVTLMLENPALTTAFMVNPAGPIMGLYYIAALGTDGNGSNCIATSSDPSLTFAFGAAPPAQFAFGATAGGSVPPGPQFTPIGSTETVFGYVPIIHVLESDLVNARVNLDTLSADVWHPRQDELDVRYALLRHYRKELADRLSVPLDPDITGNASRVTQRIV